MECRGGNQKDLFRRRNKMAGTIHLLVAILALTAHQAEGVVLAGAVAACQLHLAARASTYCGRSSVVLVSRCLSKYCKSHLPRSSLRRCWALLQISAKSSWSKSRRSFCMAQLHEIFGRKRCTLVRVLIPSVRFRVFSWVGENGFVNPAELFRGLGRMKQTSQQGLPRSNDTH